MIIVITGPTCTGKSETSLEIAKNFNAEIVNGDAFQIYTEMEIGVAKPPKDYFKQIPHHLFSFVEMTRNYSIADYQIDLRKKIEEITARNKNVVIVGGSGLYIRSALYDYKFSEEVVIDMSKYESLDNHSLHLELEKIDPIEAEKIHENNRKRVLRAIQIYLSQGLKKSEIIENQEHKPLYETRFFVREIEREKLYKLIDDRVEWMFQKGLVNEAETLYKKYGSELNAFKAIGYKELVSVFQGNKNLDEAKEEIKKNSRNYAKRQMTFIRHQFPVEFYKNTEDLLRILKNE